MEKEIDFYGIEQKWQKEWENNKCFVAKEGKAKKPNYEKDRFSMG